MLRRLFPHPYLSLFLVVTWFLLVNQWKLGSLVMAIFLATPEARYIVAQTFGVDGGYWMARARGVARSVLDDARWAAGKAKGLVVKVMNKIGI